MIKYTTFTTDREEVVIHILDKDVWIEFSEILQDNGNSLVLENDIIIFKELFNFVNNYINRTLTEKLSDYLQPIFLYLKDEDDALVEDLRDILREAKLFYYKNVSNYDELKH